MAVTDPDTARQWLDEAVDWARWVPLCHHLDLDETPCWPLHPVVVADLLALAAQRAHAYTDPTPTTVVEWLTRWLPAGLTRIRTETDTCRQNRGHHHDGRLYDPTGLTSPRALTDIATWWTTHRDTPAPTWLHLPHLD